MENRPSGPLSNNFRPPSRRRRMLLWTLGLTVLLLLAIIVSQQLWLWTVIPSDSASDTLLLYALSTLNFVAFVVFSFIFIRNLLKLRRERRERELGSKIKTRLLVYFVAISFLPIIAMAVFSYLFLNRSLEKWFNRLPEDVVKQAREVQREAVAAQNRSLRETASLFAVLLSKQSLADQQITLDQVVANGQFTGVEIVQADGVVLIKAKATLKPEDAETLENLFSQARRARLVIGETLADGKGFDVIAVPLTPDQTLVISPPRRADSDLNDAITGSQSEYQKLVKRQRTVRLLGLSTLGLMTLMLLFVSSWVAIYLARGIATPIKALAEASNEIARGNLSHRVTTFAEDELALLADSFNQMTAQLHENRRRIELGATELREKNLALEDRRNYIETVLESLSTGVISLDENDRVTTINASAARMLGLAGATNGHLGLAELVGAEDRINLERLLKRARRTGQAAEQTQLVGHNPSSSRPIPVALTATALRSSPGQGRGVVLVIEDLSELLAAQRAAAWSEVARRMAHEIKNPLTPIQLSAERIARNYRRSGTPAEANGSNGKGAEANDAPYVAAVIAECTDTINREVAGLKAMVDEFSRFARLPAARLEPADLNEVIRQAEVLYQDRLDGIEIITELGELPAAMLDTEQMRRVFINLIDNAINALAQSAGERTVTIKTRHDAERSVIVTEVADTGQGIEPSDFTRLFQPYFSRRDSGTGLGLAIVQRIILEHRSRIRAETNYPRGAKFVIEMPA
ncbi:MAG TPA: ATP-binding protein [Pyrinomonadaceae bacterium]|nr:ATP-binding protein [Pyrinomonadaceae bacterium]